jgi:hypothetical protein
LSALRGLNRGRRRFVVKQERQAVVYPSREMVAWSIEWQAEDVGEEPGGAHLVGRRHDGAVQDDGERTPAAKANVLADSAAERMAVNKSRASAYIPSSWGCHFPTYSRNACNPASVVGFVASNSSHEESSASQAGPIRSSHIVSASPIAARCCSRARRCLSIAIKIGSVIEARSVVQTVALHGHPNRNDCM